MSSLTMDDYEKPAELPNAIDMEYGLFGCILMDNSLLDSLLFLAPEHFFAHEHKAIYTRMIDMRAEGILITPFSVAASMGDQNLPDGTVKYLANTLRFSSAVMRPLEEAKYLVELSTRRAVIATCQKQIQQVLIGQKPASEHIANIGMELERVNLASTSNKFLTDVQVTRNIMHKLNNPQTPYSTGISKLDECMEGGIYPGMCYAFAGRKKMGKTTLAGTVSWNLKKQRIKHLYVAGEMGVEQIQQRNLSWETDSYSSSFRTSYGKSPEFQEKLEQQCAMSSESLIYLNAPGIAFEDLRSSIAEAISIHKIKIFVIDSLQLVGGKAARTSQAEHQDEVSQWIADFGRKHNVSSIVTAQMNQTGNIRGGESIRLACDQAYEIHAPEDDPSRSDRWLEMIETRYTPWMNVGSKTSAGLLMHEKGPHFTEFGDQGQINF